ncbi:MAG: FAD-binding protein [Faecousia sp.]
MKDDTHRESKIVRLQAAVVGSGAAGLHAALRLHQYGVQPIALITEAMEGGTSRNAGSDKQTYYKLSLCGHTPDSPASMAKDLFAGRCVDGDNAYVEAALSAPCFMNLVERGVPFPVNEFGEYVGYQTDHDVRARATSAGPLTSKMMTECLERAVRSAGVPIYDRHQVVEIIKDGDRAAGLVALELSSGQTEPRLALFQCQNIIWATGGPAGIYADSVYPRGHSGASGVPFAAGAWGSNLTEWQYGLASLEPRWNVSGTYMQVMPRFISVGEQGDEEEFLLSHFGSLEDTLSMVFRKGYQWPFDSEKAGSGSSVVDLLVHRERVLRGRRVYLDFRSNPQGLEELPFDRLCDEARDYLKKVGVCFGTPIQRLIHMNRPAYEFYRSKGVDLAVQRLEIALCAQHNNGGLAVDRWWQTTVPHLFAVGEAAGTHGVARPGGSALNAGQVGGLRAAQYIAFHKDGDEPVSEARFDSLAAEALQRHRTLLAQLRTGSDSADELLNEVQHSMTAVAGPVRRPEAMTEARSRVTQLIACFPGRVQATSPAEWSTAYRLLDVLVAQSMYLRAMEDYYQVCGCSRGSALYLDDCGTGGVADFPFLPDQRAHDTMVQQLQWNGGLPQIRWRPVRPLPKPDETFENVWRGFRENRNIL